MSKKTGAPKGNQNALGNKGGRPKSPYIRKNLVISVKDKAEWEAILDFISSPRLRTEILLNWIEATD